MILSSLTLQNFRNFKKRSFEFLPGVTVIVGPNTSGKTNILEAIYFLATGKSSRAEVEKEVIAWGEEIARVSAEVENTQALRSPTKNFVAADRPDETSGLIRSSKIFVDSPRLLETMKLEAVITTGQVAGKKAPKKQFLVNGVKKRLTDFLGNFYAVLFSPQDLQLVTDSPSSRRKYLNDVLSVVDQEYQQALLIYEKALRQRNRILDKIREKQAGFSQLDYWDQVLIKNGKIITQKREALINFLNRQYKVLKQEDYQFSIIDKRPPLNFAKFCGLSFELVYKKNEISEKRLEEKREKEILLGMTLVGPHRDDFIVAEIPNSKFQFSSEGEETSDAVVSIPNKFPISNSQSQRDLSAHGNQGKDHKSRDLSVYGSRGEQRLAVLWLKLGELNFLEEKTGQKSVLLLDDIFSELDKDHRELVTKVIPNQQTIVTMADPQMIKEEFLKRAKVIKLEK